MTHGYRRITDADLICRNTFGVHAHASRLFEVDDAVALPDLFAGELRDDETTLILGGGSNLLFAGDAPGAVVALNAATIRVVDDNGERAIVRADAGTRWHDLVMHALALGLGGLENLALIPGTVGAAPIQNIGAYGVEVESRIHAVEVFERATGLLLRMSPADCAFAYRDSAFKRVPQRWVVTAVEFGLSRNAPLMLEYAGLREELAAMAVTNPTAVQVADAVIRIRRRKLPDPAVLGNAGSFFKNPIVQTAQADVLGAEHPRLPVFPLAPFPADAAAHGDSGHACLRKLSAAWLIDACGWKGHRDGDAGVSAEHALVLVNHGRASGAQLLGLARRIADSVQARFGVALEPEPRIIGAKW